MTLSSPKLDWCWRELRVGIPAPILCAWLFSTLFGQPFLNTLVYAFCVGLLIQMLVEGGRYGLSYLLRQRRPDDLAARRNWPGWGMMGPWVLIASVAAFFPGHALGDLLLGVERPIGAHHPHALQLMFVVVIAVCAACLYFLCRMAMLDADAQRAIRGAAENQLKLLQSQLEPHMLFNTLANLRVLIGTDTQQAQAMLDHLSAFLRAMLEASRTGSHPLAAEFARIGDYLELMQVRMGDRLQCALDLPAELAGLPVPPLLLQPLVENAIKHGLESNVSGGRIDIRAARDGQVLVLSVRDNGSGLASADGSGFGLRHVRDRLAALYGPAATLELSAPPGGGVLAVARLPISPEPKNDH